jgi:hypothetical protein
MVARASEDSRVNEKTVIQYLHERKAGVSSYLKPVPDTPIYLAPDNPFVGRFERVDGNGHDSLTPGEHDREDFIWIECQPTTASRNISQRTKRSFRIRSYDHEDNRELVAESNIEEGFRLIKRAESRHNRIWDQPPARRYKLPDGSEHAHTFDYLVDEWNGSASAYAIRPEADVDENLKTAVRCIREQSLQGFADNAFIVTERFVTKAKIRNAIEILDARESRNEADVQIVSGLINRIRGGVMLDRLVQASGLGPRGRTALLCLVDDGVLEFVRKERIGPMTLLRPANGLSKLH